MNKRVTTGKFLIVLALLILMGFFGNYFPLSLFFAANFLLGSVFVLLVIYFFGLGWGMLTAVIVHSSTYFLWGHPYGFINFTSEAFFVGYFLKKGRGNLLALDWLYWVLLGMPLAWFFHGVVMHTDVITTTFIMLKQAINGIFNALLASLVICYLPLDLIFQRSQTSKRITLQATLFNLMVMMVLLPTLLFTIVQAKQEKANLEASIMAELQSLSTNVQLHLHSWHQFHLQAVQALASLIDTTSMSPSEGLQHKTEVLKQSFPDFIGMHIEDADGRTIAFDPKVNERGESTLGVNISDRSWFQEARLKQQPVVSEVFMGRAAINSPIVTIGVPVIRENRWVGCSSGTLDLGRIQNILRPYQLNKVAGNLTLTDSKNRVIASTMPERTPLKVWDWKESGMSQVLDNRMYLLSPNDKPLNIIARWQQSYYVQESSVGPELPWKLTIVAPVAPLQFILYALYVKNLAIVACLVTVALLLSYLFSHRLTRPLIQLAQVTADIPDKLAKDKGIDWPTSSAEEFNSLISNFRNMAKALEMNFHGLIQTNLQLLQEGEARQRAQENLKRSISLLHATLESTADGVLVVNREGDIVSFNQKFVDIWQIAPEILDSRKDGTYLGSILQKLKDPQGFLDRVQELYAHPELNSFDIVELLDSSIYERYSQPQYLEGTIVGRVWSFRDVTFRQKAEEEKRHLQTQLIQAQKMEAIGTLAGGIAHDFNNILGAILGFTEIAKDASPQDSFAAKNLDKVLEASHRAATLVKQILAFSRQAVIKKIPLEPAGIVKEAINLIRPSLPSTIAIKQKIDTVTKSILADPTQVHQILINLCTNAFHAMERTGGTLEIILKDCELFQHNLQQHPEIHPGSFVALSVSDTGTGIEPEIWGKIFDPYFTTKEVGKGTGMGLSIIHGIVTSYGGFITSETNLGRGTIFNVYFPALEEDVVSEIKTVEAAPLGTERILLVDDEEMLADIGKMILESLGYVVTVRTQSLEALSTFHDRPDFFDAVITDQTMPEMTGMDLARRMLEIRPDIPIILCTGYSALISEKQAKAEGIKGFAMKPLSKSVITTLLRNVLDKKALV